MWHTSLVRLISDVLAWIPKFPLSGRAGTRSHAVHSSLSRSRCGTLHESLFREFPGCFSQPRLGQPWKAAATAAALAAATSTNPESSEKSDLTQKLQSTRFSQNSEFPPISSVLKVITFQIKCCSVLMCTRTSDKILIVICRFSVSQRFIQYLASRNTLFNLNNFLDKGALQGKYSVHKHDHWWIEMGLNSLHTVCALHSWSSLTMLCSHLFSLSGYDMSTFIRRYSRYLNEKALSYRLVAVDFTKMKRG